MLMALVGAVMIAGVATLFLARTPTAALQASSSILVTALLGFVSKQVDARVRDVKDALEKVRDQARQMLRQKQR